MRSFLPACQPQAPDDETDSNSSPGPSNVSPCTSNKAKAYKLHQGWQCCPEDRGIAIASTETNFAGTVSSPRRSVGVLRRSASLHSLHSVSSIPEYLSGRCLLHPSSKVRRAWDIMAMVFLLHDAFIVPFQLLDPPGLLLYDVGKVCNACFWSADAFVSACTGVYINGQLSMNRRHIMKTYCRTWLLFDIVVITLDWLSIIFLSRSTSSFWMRLFRGVRFVRLARLVKFETMFHKYFEMGNAPSELVLLVQVFVYVGGMILFTHLLACVWYAIGLSSDKGWVHEYVPDADLWYGYFTSFHWALSCFHGTMEVVPQTTGERCFAVVIVSCALVFVSWLQSSMTNLMMQLKHIKRDFVEKSSGLRTYFSERGVTAALATSVNKCIADQRRHTLKLEIDVALLKVLPESLLMDLHAEVRVPLLMNCCYLSRLRDLHPRLIRAICHEPMNETLVHSGDVG